MQRFDDYGDDYLGDDFDYIQFGDVIIPLGDDDDDVYDDEDGVDDVWGDTY